MEFAPRPERAHRRKIPARAASWGSCVPRAGVVLLVAGLLLAPPRVLGGESAHAVPEALVAKPVHAIGVLYNALSQCRGSLPEGKRWQIAEAIEREARRHGYDPLFVQAMVEVESTCSPTAKSRMGAIGLIQIKPGTARAVAKDLGLSWSGAQGLLDPGFNVRLGLEYLNQLEERFGDPHIAIGAYNMGPTRAARLGRSRVKQSRYVQSVLKRYDDLLLAQQDPVGDPT